MNIEKSLKQLAVKLGCCASETACQKNNIGEIIDFIADNYKGGGGGEVKFYPNVITLDGYDSLAQGEQITLDQSISEGSYAILQPLNNGVYGKRALGKCVSFKEHTPEIIASKSSASLPAIGYTVSRSGNYSHYSVGDYVIEHYYRYAGSTKVTVGYVLAKVTFAASNVISIEYVEVLPNETNGVYTITEATLEVLAVLDVVAPQEPVQLYEHNMAISKDGSYLGYGIAINSSDIPMTGLDGFNTFIGYGSTFIISTQKTYNGTNWGYKLTYYTIGDESVSTVDASELGYSDTVTPL